MNKIIDKKRSIGNAAKEVGIKTHVIRFWESKFPQIKPKIGKGSRRYYFHFLFFGWQTGQAHGRSMRYNFSVA